MKTQIVTGLLCLFFITSNAQNKIEAPKGYSPQVGNLVSMLEDLKGRVTRSVANLSQEETDYLLDDDANRIGAMIMHLAATEIYYQLYTFEGRPMTAEENKKWGAAMELGDNGRASLIDKPISYYLEEWDKVRGETLKLLKTTDDKWLTKSPKGSSMNNHWAWYHVMEHQANHMGQIRLIQKRAGN